MDRRSPALHGFVPPKITVHSATPSARDKMLAGIRSIEQIVSQKKSMNFTYLAHVPHFSCS